MVKPYSRLGSKPPRPPVAEQGEAECCCGDIDEFGTHTNAVCVNCCTCRHGQQIWEGKNAGGGYYIVNPSF